MQETSFGVHAQVSCVCNGMEWNGMEGKGGKGRKKNGMQWRVVGSNREKASRGRGAPPGPGTPGGSSPPVPWAFLSDLFPRPFPFHLYESFGPFFPLHLTPESEVRVRVSFRKVLKITRSPKTNAPNPSQSDRFGVLTSFGVFMLTGSQTRVSSPS